jgi:hypothetical protein
MARSRATTGACLYSKTDTDTIGFQRWRLGSQLYEGCPGNAGTVTYSGHSACG